MTLPFAARERVPLYGVIKQKFIDVDGNEFFWHIHINRVIGEGRSCLCYDVEVEKGPANHQRMIMKQFYPEPGTNEISVTLDGTTMNISHLDKRPDIQELANQFEEAFLLQNQLASTIDQIVKPSVNYFDGMTKLVLYEVNSGESLDKFIQQKPEQLSEMLEVVEKTAEALHSVHEAGYLHMDLKPENILWNSKSKTVKLFDFDSAINMKNLSRYVKIEHDGREGRTQTLAPELRTFEDKRLFLEPRVDVYTLGCILFEYIMGQCPSDSQCLNPEKFKDDFHDRMFEIYDDKYSFEEQEAIFKVLSKSIHYRVDYRYETAEELAEELKSLRAKLKASQKKRMKVADNNILSGYVLDEFPVCNYKNKSIDVSIVGELPIRDAFLMYIYSCAQMMDTELNIRVFAEDAKAYMESLLERCPQLIGTTNVYLNQEKYINEPMNERITSEPFANLYFTEVGDESEFYLGSRYYVLVDKKIANNKDMAKRLLEYWEDKEEKVFIGYGKRGHGGLRVQTDIETKNPRVYVKAFCCDAHMTDREKLFKTEIYRKALDVHTFYTKQWNEKAEKDEIERDLFTKDEMGNFYNLNSSLRCALSIKYKYSACDIPQNVDNAKVLYEKVIAQNSPKAKALYDKLTYLEHRSWMCFMIMQGFRRPTDVELKEYFFRDGNDHRNKKKRLHPCICASKLAPKKVLKDLSYSQWNEPETLCDEAYDELDRMSLKMHAMAEERVKGIRFDEDFEDLTVQLQTVRADEELLQLKKNLQKVAERMLSGESEINAIWNKSYQYFRSILVEMDVQDAIRILDGINYEMKVVKERNLFHDYKSSDGTIIEGIPRIVMKREDVYRRVYKTPTNNVGNLVISTLLLEPEELVLIVEEENDYSVLQQEMVRQFLGIRGLGHIHVTCSTMDHMKKAKSNKKSVIDVTDCNEKFMLKLLSSGMLTDMSIIRCENGKLVPECNADAIRYYLQPRHLTVKETLALSDAHMSEQEYTKHIMSLGYMYEQLWNAYLQLDDQDAWAETIRLLSREEEKNQKVIVLSGECGVCETESIYTFLLEHSGLEDVLEKMKQKGFLIEYQLPPKQVMEGKVILKGDNGVLSLICNLVSELRNDIAIRFYYKDESICRETLSFEAVIDRETAPKVEKVLTQLYECGKQSNQEFILQKKDGKDFITAYGEKCKVAFKFANQAIKYCLLDECRVLETFAYHAILQKAHLFDVKSNVLFNLGKSASVVNEISLVCTKGIQTLFVLCTMKKVDKDLLTEIRYYSDYFGINGEAIVLYAGEADEEILSRSKAMKVHFLDKTYLKNDMELALVIDEIAKGQR